MRYPHHDFITSLKELEKKPMPTALGIEKLNSAYINLLVYLQQQQAAGGLSCTLLYS